MTRSAVNPARPSLSARIRASAYPKTNALPPVLLQGKTVLDLGCGCHPMAVDGARVFGIDAVALPRPAIRDKIEFARASMEALPFAEERFDFVSARVSLNYSHMPTTILEVRRVLKAGGMLWGTLIARPEALARMLASLVGLRFQDAAFVGYCFCNGMLARFFGKQVRWIGAKRCESVNSARSIRRLLRDAGFVEIYSENCDNRVVFSALKAPEPLVSTEILRKTLA